MKFPFLNPTQRRPETTKYLDVMRKIYGTFGPLGFDGVHRFSLYETIFNVWNMNGVTDCTLSLGDENIQVEPPVIQI
jgi:hypothetical protein